jgi:hypothetical protein
MLGCDVWADIEIERDLPEIGTEKKTVSVCAKVYRDQIEFFYKTEGCDELTEREWQKAEEKILHG